MPLSLGAQLSQHIHYVSLLILIPVSAYFDSKILFNRLLKNTEEQILTSLLISFISPLVKTAKQQT